MRSIGVAWPGPKCTRRSLLAKISSIPPYFSRLGLAPGGQRSLRADGSRLALVPTSRTSSALRGRPPLRNKLGGPAVVGHERSVAVVVDVAGGQRAADGFTARNRGRTTTDFLEPAAALVAEQQLALRFLGARPEVTRSCSSRGH